MNHGEENKAKEIEFGKKSVFIVQKTLELFCPAARAESIAALLHNDAFCPYCGYDYGERKVCHCRNDE